MEKRENLIYQLIFSEENNHEINISDYISDIYKYEIFIKEIKNILKKSKVSVVMESVDLSPKNVIWKLKVKK